jgi:hypothetical protein
MLAARIGDGVRCLQRLAAAPLGHQACRITAPGACVALGVAPRAMAVVVSPFVLSGVPSMVSGIVGGRAPEGPAPWRHPVVPGVGVRSMSLWAAATLVRPRLGGLFRTHPTSEPVRASDVLASFFARLHARPCAAAAAAACSLSHRLT